MEKKLGEEYDGIISGVLNFGFFVRLIGPSCDGLVRASTLDDDYYAFEESRYRLVGRRKGKVFRLGDKVRVSVMRVDVDEKEIDLYLVEHRGTEKSTTAKRSKNRKKRKKK